MADFFSLLNSIMGTVNGFLWHDYVLFTILGTGILFLLWSKFAPFVALTHGIQVVRGKYDKEEASSPGAITHFQALSAALSATVGLGNIGGVAVAIALGGPGAVFWMWVVGFIGMALKMIEVTLSMLYRDVSDPSNPHGGPMHVVSKGLERMNPSLAGVGKFFGGLFCVTLLISTMTGGNMFQAWNVATLNEQYLNMPPIVTGLILAVITGLVIIGGIKRIGVVAGTLVPFMCGLYLVAALYVVFTNISLVPETIRLIFTSAFSSAEAEGAFVGGTVGFAFMWGMKRALFSNEAGQGSAPIAHAAARTKEPVREGIVAGLEPFIDTIVVCTLTSLVILMSGAWNRGPEATIQNADINFVQTDEGAFQLAASTLPAYKMVKDAQFEWREGQRTFALVEAHSQKSTGTNLHRLHGTVAMGELGQFTVNWDEFRSDVLPKLVDKNIYGDYAGAALTSHAFDRVQQGLGRYLVSFAAFLFAISTMISWSYYGEQGTIFLFGEKAVLPYKFIFCVLTVVACSGFIKSDAELDNLTGFGMGMMLLVNIPICLLFSRQAMNAYHSYMKRLKKGEFS